LRILPRAPDWPGPLQYLPGGSQGDRGFDLLFFFIYLFGAQRTKLLYHVGFLFPQTNTATIILRGGAEQFLAEAERSLHDSIMVRL
jgi:hypothetical protein